jgi:endonuclease/exonuclease/phosphatase family metal-dependent hydrolase
MNSVMTIHTDLAARHIQRLTESGKGVKQNQPMPYILAGDWNIKPDR